MNLLKNKIIVFLKKAGLAGVGVFSWLVGKLLKKKTTVNDNQEAVDRQLVYSLSPQKIPTINQIKHVKKFLNSKEYLWVKILAAIIIVNLAILGIRFYKNHLKVRPANGGSYYEALVGSPKFINPLYNYNRSVDADLSSLVFSGLFKRDQTGILQNDLVDKWELSADGKVYSITLKDNIKFHNGSKLTVDDVIFTFEAIKNLDYNSSWRSAYLGAEVARVDDLTITFTLAEPYAAFRDLLTFGILPQNLWQAIDPEAANLAELNLKPIGSGPYVFKSLTKSRSGDVKEYVFEANDDYYGDHRPYIETLTFKFYPNATEAIAALNNNAVDGLSYLAPENNKDVLAKNSLNFNKINTSQLSAIFFNKKNNVALGDLKVRQALSLAIDKDKIIKEVLNGDATVTSGPILPFNFAYNPDLKIYNYNLDEANKILDAGGYKKITISEEEAKGMYDITAAEAAKDTNLALKRDLAQIASSSQLTLAGDWRVKMATKKGWANLYLTMNLTTTDSPINTAAAGEIKTAWEALGVKTGIKTVPVAQVQNDIIKPRNFESLLFSQMVGADPDLYVFWHSSQANSNGLNIADYKNKDVDALLESARLATDEQARIDKYKKFQDILVSEIPAIFLYSPSYVYPQSKSIKGLDAKFVAEPHDRLTNISNWYIKTKKRLVFGNN